MPVSFSLSLPAAFAEPAGGTVSLDAWIMIGITAVYVVATVLISVFNRRSAKAMHEQVRELARQFDEVDRPRVDATVEAVRGELLCLCFRNTGRRVARNVRIVLNDGFIDGLESAVVRDGMKRLQASVFHLGVDQRWYAPIGTVHKGGCDRSPLKIRVLYEDERRNYEDGICVELALYNWMLMYDSPIDEIRRSMKQLTAR